MKRSRNRKTFAQTLANEKFSGIACHGQAGANLGPPAVHSCIVLSGSEFSMRRISGAALVGLATSAAVTAALVTPAGMAAADPSSQARPVARTSSAAPPDTV